MKLLSVSEAISNPFLPGAGKPTAWVSVYRMMTLNHQHQLLCIFLDLALPIWNHLDLYKFGWLSQKPVCLVVKRMGWANPHQEPQTKEHERLRHQRWLNPGKRTPITCHLRTAPGRCRWSIGIELLMKHEKGKRVRNPKTSGGGYKLTVIL